MEDILTNLNDDEVESLINSVVDQDEMVYIVLQGAFKEYLICSDANVYILKKGFMTGHTFGKGLFKMPYRNITNVEIEFHLLSGYFEISTAGVENKDYNFASFKKGVDPAKQPNVISIYSGTMRENFEQAAHFIMDKISEANVVHVATQQSSADEIKKYKELLDEGVITEEEFEVKKNQLLGL